MSGPSEKAVQLALVTWFGRPAESLDHEGAAVRDGKRMLNAAHSPALGLDRSVCLRDVVEWLRGVGQIGGQQEDHGYLRAAAAIEREFGQGEPRG